jgi:hypothetical protein
MIGPTVVAVEKCSQEKISRVASSCLLRFKRITAAASICFAVHEGRG